MPRTIDRYLCCLAIAVVFGSATQARAQTPAASPNASPSAAAGSSGAVTIESTILAYQGLQLDADAIAGAIDAHVAAGSKMVIATPSDIAAILRLRIVLFQIATIDGRLQRLNYVVKGLTCAKREKAFATTSVVSGLGDVTTMLTAVSGLTSVNESTASLPGNFLDSTLINLVAGHLLPKSYCVRPRLSCTRR